jgi:cytochrome c556
MTPRLAPIASLAVYALCSSLAYAQAAPAKPAAQAPTPVPYASATELNGVLTLLDQASQAAQADLAKLRVEKWKMDANYKRQTQSNVESVQRNLQTALPEITGQLRNSPEDLKATFKLYRNLDALYDVLGSITESAGAFGSKDEFQSISNDLNSFERARRQLAERLENLTASKETELAGLREQIKTLQAQVPPPAPKKVVVDDNEAPKKTPAKKKKPVPKPPTVTTPAPAAPASQTPPQ